VALADSLLALTIHARPGWATLHEWRAVALRARRRDDAAVEFLTLVDFGIVPADAPEHLTRCRGAEETRVFGALVQESPSSTTPGARFVSLESRCYLSGWGCLGRGTASSR